MPIYAYICESCQQETEMLLKIGDPDPLACPSCGKHSLQRCLTAPFFRLSGSGWYETDFKKEKQKNLMRSSDAESGKKADSEKKEKGDGKQDTTSKKEDGKKTDSRTKKEN